MIECRRVDESVRAIARTVTHCECDAITASAFRNSSQSRMPYTILSHRASGSASGVASARIQREIGSARSVIVVQRSLCVRHRDLDAHEPPHRVVAQPVAEAKVPARD